jgi:hypothetical protein
VEKTHLHLDQSQYNIQISLLKGEEGIARAEGTDQPTLQNELGKHQLGYKNWDQHFKKQKQCVQKPRDMKRPGLNKQTLNSYV